MKIQHWVKRALNFNISGNSNTAVGERALKNNTSGMLNTAVGLWALTNNTTGASNTSIGRNSLRDQTTSFNNVAIGESAGVQLTSGDENTFVGTVAASNKLSGSQNVFLGNSSGTNNTNGNGNIFIGYNSGANETGSNKLYIDNSNSSTPLIYGNLASDSLKIFGSLSVGEEYTLPLTDGSSGQILETDGAGQVSWVTPPAGDVDWTVGTGEIYNATDRVGIGTASPSAVSQSHINSNYEIGLLIGQTYGGPSGYFGIQNNLLQPSTSGKTAFHTSMSNASSGSLVGYSANISGSGGVNNYLAGVNTSVINGDGNHEGVYNNVQGTSASHNIGVYNIVGALGSGPGYGTRSSVTGAAGQTGVLVGTQNTVATGDGVKYGYQSIVTQTSSESVYGYYGLINNSSGNTYGMYMSGEDDNYFSGNVGIGNTSPQSKLHVETDGSLLGGIRLVDQQSTSVGASIHFDAFSQDWDIYASNSGATAGGDKLLFRNYTGATDVMAITSANQVGIGTVNPTATLDVVGTLQYVDGSESDGAVLTSDGSGNATWKPSRVAFYEGQSLSATQQTIPQGVPTRLQFTGGGNSLTFNDGGGYNAATYEFIAPVTGVYQFNINAVFAGGTNQTCNIMVMSDIQGRVAEETGVFNPDAANWYSANMSVTLRLVANERISVDFLKASGGNSSLYQDKSSFSGHLIYAD